VIADFRDMTTERSMSNDAIPAQQDPSGRKIRILGIVAFDGLELLDLTGPMDVFGMANAGLLGSGAIAEPAYRFRVIAREPGLVTTSCGLKLHADSAYGALQDDLDTLLIPGAPEVGAVLADPALRDWVTAMSSRVNRLVSVCTGAFLLADAGLLNGRGATTHWAYCERLAAEYPQVRVEPDRIFLKDGSIYTSGGITSGIDLALSLLEEDWGRETSLLVARYMVVFLKRPGGQTQFSGYLASEATQHPDLRSLQVWIMENPAEDMRIEALAERVAMSPRNFARVFQAETGMTPAKFVEKARVDAARHFLGSGENRIETVATVAGFGDPERMRRSFIRHLGISPQDYRERFGEPIATSSPPVMTDTRATVLADALKRRSPPTLNS
jgi:transcriptional regulator GlxA family with amidase domain